MSVGSPLSILRVPGQLCINPTDLSIDFPHGGTAIGETKEKVITQSIGRVSIQAEELGEVVEEIITDTKIVFACLIRGYDADAISTVFPNTVVGSITGERVINGPGTVRAGTRNSTRSVILCFSPEDLDNHPMGLFLRALPMLSETMELNLALQGDFEMGIVFNCIRDTNGRMYQIGLRDDLSLT